MVGLVPELTKLGWRSEVHAPAEAGTDGRALEAVGATFRTFRARYPYLGLNPQRRAQLVASSGNLLSIDELISLVGQRRGNVLHAHTLGRLGGVVRTAARLRRVPYAVTLHGPVRANASVIQRDAVDRTRGMFDLGSPFGWAVGARSVVKDADMVFTLNASERNAWRDERRGRHLALVAHGVDPTPASGEARAAARELVGPASFALVVGRLTRTKGQDVVIDAFLAGVPPPHRLLLAGAAVDEDYARELSERAHRSDGRVQILGGVLPAVARALMAEAEIVLVPSRAEPFGIVLLEAWAEGVPALASDVDGLAEIGREVGAPHAFVPAGDAQAWSARLCEVFADRTWLRVERESARERVVRHYTWRSLAENIVGAYEQALALKGTRAA
jgi:glycosyltransferase involved in cell wall biosynthesis